MPKVKSLSQRRSQLLSLLGRGSLAMRSCKTYLSSGNPYRVAAGSEKCIECIRLTKHCDLASLDAARFRRLQSQREKLRQEYKELYAKQQELLAKQQRLLRQLDFVESEQNKMVDSELRNINGLEKEEGTNVPKPLFDMPSEQIIFPDSPSF